MSFAWSRTPLQTAAFTMGRIVHFKRIGLCAGLAVLFGCTPDSSLNSEGVIGSENRPPSVKTISVVPNPILKEGVVTAVVEGEDPNHDELKFQFQWFVNGMPVPGESSSTLDVQYVKRGDRVSVEVVPNDGKADGTSKRAADVVVGNTPPSITEVVLEPKAPKSGDRMTAAVEASDPDGDEIHYRYVWRRNNQVVQDGDQQILEMTDYARNDIVTVSVVPRDRDNAGKEVRAQSAALGNHPPKVVSSAPTASTQGIFDYAVQATDSENDPLTYSLETAPSGMSINERNGRIQWALPAASNHPYHVRVIVRDDHHGWAFQEFDITVAPTPAS
ncbi:hypothetical protein W02_21110 [Nitrospira sp. KM1]|uniref:Ig domain-containing protein n=1 Tax=Nitrospira sp. KM1 TaxID=1936990 RepID=UPI0013A75F02|nr:Ig domain-containing protein [Nitrospira sp. KM1]BCA54971.1 hypothetical protein W02_21110 [Nitrospira sp. KM1]